MASLMTKSITWKMRPVCESLTATWLPVSSVCIHLREHHDEDVNEECEEEDCDEDAVDLTTYFPPIILII